MFKIALACLLSASLTVGVRVDPGQLVQFSLAETDVQNTASGTQRRRRGKSGTHRRSGKPKTAHSHPTRDDMVAAKILYVKQKQDYTKDPKFTSIDDMKAFLGDGQGTQPWATLPGLRHKYFTYNSETQTVGGVYVWFSQKYLDSYMQTDLFKDAAKWPNAAETTAQVMDVCPGTERCIENTKWPHSPPTREDLTAGKMLIVEAAVNYSTGIEGLPTTKEELYAGFDAGGYTKNFANVEGLRGKYFAYDDSIDHIYGFYTYTTEASLKKYMDSDLFKNQALAPHLTLTYEVHDILEGTERTMDLSSWGLY